MFHSYVCYVGFSKMFELTEKIKNQLLNKEDEIQIDQLLAKAMVA